jgi:ubiquinone/menaquinone biosynthesis C-methylase UbiE
MLKGISLRGLVIMDAGTGAANTTCWLADKVKEAGSGRIISIDNDPETFPNAERKLGKLVKWVKFVKADLTNMPQIESESVDLIVCHATMCAVNDRPLKAMKALSEFYRILKKDGWLVIADEFPLPKASKPEEEVQVGRWQTYKAMAELVDGEHYTEIYPEELRYAVKLVGFTDIELQRFEDGLLSSEVMEEWKEEMPGLVNKIADNDLKAAFEKVIERIWQKYINQGGIFPDYYVMRARKR